MSTQESKTTHNHNTIKNWIEEREGEPALVDGVIEEGKAGEMLRIDFHGPKNEILNSISWELFFQIFDENNLELLYREITLDGELDKFYEFIKKNRNE